MSIKHEVEIVINKILEEEITKLIKVIVEILWEADSAIGDTRKSRVAVGVIATKARRALGLDEL